VVGVLTCVVQLSMEYTRSSYGATGFSPKPHSKPVSCDGAAEGAGSLVGHDSPCPNQSAPHPITHTSVQALKGETALSVKSRCR
jgi:hypothetical protein